MKEEDLFYTTGNTTIFYSSIHAFKGNEVKVNTEWWVATEEALTEILAGKYRYEQLRLVVKPEEINDLLEKAITKNNLQSTIEKALDSSLEQMKVDINRVTNSFKRVIPQVQDAVEEIAKAVSSTNSYKTVLESTSKTIEKVKDSLPSSDEIKDTLTEVKWELKDAKKEFTKVTNKLKELFK